MAGGDEKLSQYRSMRDFEVTPEPAAGAPSPEGNRFVVQEHHATALHWDFRLERDGVLVSWAVPKGLPPDPRQNGLAVHTEDHPMSYIDFAGEIPAGSYGGGTVTVWDAGTYECHKWSDREVQVTLHGERVEGRYVLFQTKGRNWMIHRMDPPSDPTREQMPAGLRPMRAVAGDVPEDEEAWGFEVLWDGARAILSCEGGRIRLELEDGTDVSDHFPELRQLGRAIGSVAVVLDGVLVTLGADGRPSGERLELRLRAGSDSTMRRRAAEAPVVFMLVDVLWLEGHSVLDLPYTERRRLLDDLGLAGANWQSPAWHREGAVLLEAGRAQGLPGVVAKRLDSPYRPGETSEDWRVVRA